MSRRHRQPGLVRAAEGVTRRLPGRLRGVTSAV